MKLNWTELKFHYQNQQVSIEHSFHSVHLLKKLFLLRAAFFEEHNQGDYFIL